MPQEKKHIIIIGAGPGGLTTAMLLANRGFKVTIFEKEPVVGGRNAAIRRNGFVFDTGPTFLMMKFILDEVFEESGRRIDDYLKFAKLEPMYRLQFDDRMVEPTTDHDAMRRQIEKLFPGNGPGLDKFLKTEQRRFDLMYPCLQKDYSSFSRFFSKDFLKAMPILSVGRSLIQVLGDYFNDDKLKLSFTFQSKYLGMSAWECPGAFGILPLVEHAYGVYHVMGGLSEISEAMAKIAVEHGAVLRLSTPVKQLILEGRVARGVELENGERILGDEVVLNADFAHAMTRLVPSGALRKYTSENLAGRDYSCSTFMLYLGLDKIYDMPHHAIVFARDYAANIEDIFKHKRLSKDTSFYVRNASVTDPSLAPPGKSSLYVLVPVPNQSSGIDWTAEKEPFRRRVLDAMKERTVMKDLESHIETEIVYTPDTWRDQLAVYNGATFNLSHRLLQMLYFRPHNRFEELDHCYLVGGGTHPGSGLPTIYESGRIAANLISRAYRVPFVSKNRQV
jgi:phytoene desaturase